MIESVKTPLSAREVAIAFRDAYSYVSGSPPSVAVLALLMAQSAFETGRWENIRNFNFGGIKAGPGWNGDVQTHRCFEHVGGDRISYPAGDPHCMFRSYGSAEEGAKDYIGLLSKRASWWEALHSGSPYTFVERLKAGGYFTGNLEAYKNGVASLWREYTAALDPKARLGDILSPESLATGEPSLRQGSALRSTYIGAAADLPTLREGSRGDAVALWQRLIGVKPDGIFGPVTLARTRQFQAARGVGADGIVGPITWKVVP